jgi:hypothetical protein
VKSGVLGERGRGGRSQQPRRRLFSLSHWEMPITHSVPVALLLRPTTTPTLRKFVSFSRHPIFHLSVSFLLPLPSPSQNAVSLNFVVSREFKSDVYVIDFSGSDKVDSPRKCLPNSSHFDMLLLY